MKAFAMLKIGEVGWIEKERPLCGARDAICKPLAVAICTSDVHTVWEGAVGERHNLILGHECCAEIVEVGCDVRDFKPGDRVLISKYGGTEIKLDGEDYLILSENDILAIID